MFERPDASERCTHLMSLHIINNSDTHNYWLSVAREHYDTIDHEGDGPGILYGDVTTHQDAIYEMAKVMEEEHENQMIDAMEATAGAASWLSDIAGFAFAHIEWADIAERFFDIIDENTNTKGN